MQKRSLVSGKGLETSSQVPCLLRSDGQKSLCVSHARKTGHRVLLPEETLSGPLSLTNELQQGLLPFTLLAEVPQRIFFLRSHWPKLAQMFPLNQPWQRD